jgi:hypothetical protein
MGVLWSREFGYRDGLWAMLLMSVAGIACLIFAQRFAQRRNVSSSSAQ